MPNFANTNMVGKALACDEHLKKGPKSEPDPKSAGVGFEFLNCFVV